MIDWSGMACAGLWLLGLLALAVVMGVNLQEMRMEKKSKKPEGAVEKAARKGYETLHTDSKESCEKVKVDSSSVTIHGVGTGKADVQAGFTVPTEAEGQRLKKLIEGLVEVCPSPDDPAVAE